MPALIWTLDTLAKQAGLATKGAVEELRKRAPEMAMAVGVSVLANVQEAYRAKARKQSSEDGIVWRDLSRATLEARVRRRAAARAIVEQRRKKADDIKRRIADPERFKNHITRQGKKIRGDDAIEQLQRERKDLSAKLQGLIDHEESSAEIGVDTGLQINSASPGFTDPNSGENSWSRTPSDSLGANLFIVNAGTVTIGYNRTYSAAFDAERQILPTDMPDPWRIEAETAGRDWADIVLKDWLQ